MPSKARWQARLVEEFAVDAASLSDLNGANRKALRTAVDRFVERRSDVTRDAVLLILIELDIPSTLVTLNRYRMQHIGFAAKRESTADAVALQEFEVQNEKELLLLLGVMTTKFQLPTTKAHIDVSNKKVNLGGGFYFQYEVKNESVDLILVDSIANFQVPLFSGDPPERLGEIMQECMTFRDRQMREMSMKSKPDAADEQDPPPWRGSYADEPSEKTAGDDDDSQASAP